MNHKRNVHNLYLLILLILIISFVVREGIEPSLFPISLQLFTTLA
nr:MAG TPA: transmembrane cytochrome C oxidase subunit [Caudoviricetes sp.]